MTTRRAASLRPGQLRHLISVASVTGRMPERDVMLLYLTHTTGIRVTELAMLEVGDVLYPSGAIRPEVYLRAEITKGCRPRNIYLTQPRCLDAIERWIGVRLGRGWGVSSEIEYRGLRADSRLVMTHKGEAFEMAFKRRVLESGPEVYRACDAPADDQQALPPGRHQARQLAQWAALTGCPCTGRDRRRGDGADDPGTPAPRSQQAIFDCGSGDYTTSLRAGIVDT